MLTHKGMYVQSFRVHYLIFMQLSLFRCQREFLYLNGDIKFKNFSIHTFHTKQLKTTNNCEFSKKLCPAIRLTFSIPPSSHYMNLLNF